MLNLSNNSGSLTGRHSSLSVHSNDGGFGGKDSELSDEEDASSDWDSWDEDEEVTEPLAHQSGLSSSVTEYSCLLMFFGSLYSQFHTKFLPHFWISSEPSQIETIWPIKKHPNNVTCI